MYMRGGEGVYATMLQVGKKYAYRTENAMQVTM